MLKCFKFLNSNRSYATPLDEISKSLTENSMQTFIEQSNLLASVSNKSGIDYSNITENCIKSSLWPGLQLYNWREQAEKIQQPEYVVMLILCAFALITNSVSIIAVSHVRHSLTTHLKLIINLAVSDIFIVLSVLMHILNKIFNSAMSPLSIGFTEPNSRLLSACSIAGINSINIMSFLIVLLNLLAMAADHYIAIMKSFHYPYIMSRRRGYMLIAAMWITATLGGFSNFLIGTIGYKSQTLFNYCEYIMYDSYHAEFLVFGVTIICLFTMTFIYTRIFIEVKRIQAKMPSIPNYTLHNKKALTTTLLIIGAFVICWLPNCLFQLAMIVEIHLHKRAVYKVFSTFVLVSKYLYILQLANCFLDPIIYAVRLKTVQKGYRNFLKRLRSINSDIIWSLKRDGSRQPLFNSKRRQTKTVLIETSTDNKSGHMCCTNPDTQPALSENQKFCKLSDESDVNDNDLVQMATFCERVSTDTPQEYIPMIVIHQTQNNETANTDGTVLLRNCHTNSVTENL